MPPRFILALRTQPDANVIQSYSVSSLHSVVRHGFVRNTVRMCLSLKTTRSPDLASFSDLDGCVCFRCFPFPDSSSHAIRVPVLPLFARRSNISASAFRCVMLLALGHSILSGLRTKHRVDGTRCQGRSSHGWCSQLVGFFFGLRSH